MKLVDRVKEILMEDIHTQEDIDKIMEKEKYFPVEQDDEDEVGILKYSNSKSQLWVKYTKDSEDYLVLDVTMRTKKEGKTTVHAFRNTEDIKKMMDYFRDNKKYDEFLIFMLGIFLARRIGDVLSLAWSDFYYENGKRKETLNTLIEQKTDKIIDIALTGITWEYLDEYCSAKRINPMEHFEEDIFQSIYKENVYKGSKEYYEAIKKQAAAFRYKFKKAADYNNIVGVSTHSMRKSFGYIAHELNKYDPDCLPTLQTVFGHSDIETTKRYIDIMNEKAEKMFMDVGKYVKDIDHGITPCIDNTPVVALKTNDLRDILIAAYNMGNDEEAHDGMDAMHKLLSIVEKVRVS